MAEHFCCIKDCSGEPKLYPVFLFWARGFPKQRGEECRAIMQMPICTKCARTLKFEDLITDEGWEQIERGFEGAGKYLPNRAFSELEFIPIGTEDVPWPKEADSDRPDPADTIN